MDVDYFWAKCGDQWSIVSLYRGNYHFETGESFHPGITGELGEKIPTNDELVQMREGQAWTQEEMDRLERQVSEFKAELGYPPM